MYFLFVLLCYICICFCSDWDCDTVMMAVSLLWQFYLLCLFCSRIVVKYNGSWCDCHTSERFSVIKPGSIHHFLHLKMPVPSQEYDSWCPFVWRVLSFDFAMCYGTFQLNFPRSSVFLWFYSFPNDIPHERVHVQNMFMISCWKSESDIYLLIKSFFTERTAPRYPPR